MIRTLVADAESDSIVSLREQLASYCPQVEIAEVVSSETEVCRFFQKEVPQLIFVEMNLIKGEVSCLFENAHFDFETILLSSTPKAIDNDRLPGAGSFLLKPVQPGALIHAVQQAQHWIQWKEKQRKSLDLLDQFLHHGTTGDLIGIPTIEGMEFLRAGEILRCEGLHRFTRIVTTDGKGLVSSYNIGVFRDLLEPQGFFSPHKSHLVNLQYIRRFLQEGTLVMRDGSTVPVARRRRQAFLDQVRHL